MGKIIRNVENENEITKIFEREESSKTNSGWSINYERYIVHATKRSWVVIFPNGKKKFKVEPSERPVSDNYQKAYEYLGNYLLDRGFLVQPYEGEVEVESDPSVEGSLDEFLL